MPAVETKQYPQICLRFRQKTAPAREQNGVVAVPSQRQTITAPALPRSNQIDATLFELISQRD
jgi:hypothetical protein